MFPGDPHTHPYTLIQPAEPGLARSLADKLLVDVVHSNPSITPHACFVQAAPGETPLCARTYTTKASKRRMWVHPLHAPSGRSFLLWTGHDGSIVLGRVTNSNDLALYPDSLRLTEGCIITAPQYVLATEVDRLWDARSAGEPLAIQGPYAGYTHASPFAQTSLQHPLPIVPAWLPTANLLMHVPPYTGWHRHEPAPLSHPITDLFLHAVRILTDRIDSGALPHADTNLLQAVLTLGLPARDAHGVTRPTRPRFCVQHKRSVLTPFSPSGPSGAYMDQDHAFCQDVASKTAHLTVLDLPTCAGVYDPLLTKQRSSNSTVVLRPSVVELRLNAYTPTRSAHQRLEQERRWSQRSHEPYESSRFVTVAS